MAIEGIPTRDYPLPPTRELTASGLEPAKNQSRVFRAAVQSLRRSAKQKSATVIDEWVTIQEHACLALMELSPSRNNGTTTETTTYIRVEDGQIIYTVTAQYHGTGREMSAFPYHRTLTAPDGTLRALQEISTANPFTTSDSGEPHIHTFTTLSTKSGAMEHHIFTAASGEVLDGRIVRNQIGEVTGYTYEIKPDGKQKSGNVSLHFAVSAADRPRSLIENLCWTTTQAHLATEPHIFDTVEQTAVLWEGHQSIVVQRMIMQHIDNVTPAQRPAPRFEYLCLDEKTGQLLYHFPQDNYQFVHDTMFPGS